MSKRFIPYLILCSFSLSTGLAAGLLEDQTQGQTIENPFATSIDKRRVLERFEAFNEKHFALDDSFAVRYIEEGPAYFDAQLRALMMPISLLKETNQALLAKYPNQHEVRERIFADTFEQMLWRTYAQALISHFNIKLIGDEHINLDNFVMVMLLNDRFDSADFILDAAEEYLVVDRASFVLDSEQFPSELEYDIFRYRLMACLILGKEGVQSDERIEELAIQDPQYQSCEERYLATSYYWLEILSPHLRATSPMKTWFLPGADKEFLKSDTDSVL